MRIPRLHLVDTAADDRFGWTILVNQPRLWGGLPPKMETFGQQIFTSDHECSRHTRRLALANLMAKQFQVSRRDLDETAVTRSTQSRQQILCSDVLGQQLHASTRQERCVEARDREVEGNRAVNGNRKPRPQSIGFDCPP